MARKKLTKMEVDKLPLTDQSGVQDFYYDTELKGFGLRVGYTSKTYFAETKVHGKTVRVTLGKHGVITAEEAKRKQKFN